MADRQRQPAAWRAGRCLCRGGARSRRAGAGVSRWTPPASALRGGAGAGRAASWSSQPERTGASGGSGPDGAGGAGCRGNGAGAERRRTAGGAHARARRRAAGDAPMACCGCRRWMCRCKARSARGTRSWAATALALARGGSKREALAWGTAAGATAIACAGTARMRRADVEARFRELMRTAE